MASLGLESTACEFDTTNDDSERSSHSSDIDFTLSDDGEVGIKVAINRKIISKVKKRPYLYGASSAGHHDLGKVKNAWESINKAANIKFPAFKGKSF